VHDVLQFRALPARTAGEHPLVLTLRERTGTGQQHADSDEPPRIRALQQPPDASRGEKAASESGRNTCWIEKSSQHSRSMVAPRSAWSATCSVSVSKRWGGAFDRGRLANGLLGLPMPANVWMRVAPSDLETVGNALSRQDEVAFCAALTGPATLTAAVICRDSADLYRYVTTRISALPQITQLEISPLVRRVKQAGTLVEGARLAHAARARATLGRRARVGAG
jgi:DNA-binding Lrp family transcriptional regulator